MNAIIKAEPPSLLNIIAAAASDDRVDIDKLTALIELQERVSAKQSIAAYAEAMAEVAAEIEPIKRDAINPTFQRRYASLDAIDAALRPIYGKHGFSVSYGSEAAPSGQICITCTVAHRAGHSKTERMTAPLDLQQGGRGRSAVQAVGSTISYLRRYLIMMAFNVSTQDDDDGEATRPAGTQQRPTGGRAVQQGQPRETERVLSGDGLPTDLAGRTAESIQQADIDRLDEFVAKCGRASDASRLRAWEQKYAHPFLQYLAANGWQAEATRLDDALKAAWQRIDAASAQQPADTGGDPFDVSAQKETA
jgi:hypothetical protein